jgi:kynurenine 3-monooxygenase
MEKKITVIGAGPCGALLALRLAQRGYEVSVFERRPDLRKADISAGRSINLALSDRGLRGLALAGVDQQALQLVIPMHGRMIHPVEGPASLVRYSGREGEWINSVSRGGLNCLLLDRAEAMPNIKLHFEAECTRADIHTGAVHVRMADGTEKLVEGDLLIGTDGAGSVVRQTMFKEAARLRFDFSQQYLNTGYKELEIPPGPGASYLLEKNALHIWPRSGFMMIALPNLNGSFTLTLFLSMTGDISFEKLHSDGQIQTFFNTYFSSAKALMPELLDDFNNNPTSSLATIKCYPWQVGGKTLLMGDAAHAVVPFYGQGMNASFEDVVVFDGLIDAYDGDWSRILPEYQAIRKKDTDAIADLAVENEFEMRDATANPVFQRKRAIELQLEQKYPEYFSKYSMVTFREDLPYHVAMEKGRRQDALLMDLARKLGDAKEIPYDDIFRQLQSLD